MYNSAIFSSTSLSDPVFFVVTDDFLTGAPYALQDYAAKDNDIAGRLQRLRNSTTTSHLDIKGCSKAYGTDLISEWGDALAVTTAHSTNNSLLSIGEINIYGKLICTAYTGAPFGDVNCQGDSMTYQQFGAPGTLSFKSPISHCLAEKVPQHCRICFSISLMSGVIVCNLLKIICMGYMVWRLDPRPLATVGDALASFLDSPGRYTAFSNPLITVHIVMS